MAQQFTASIYGANENDWKRPMGVVRSFPAAGVTMETLSPAVTYSGVACNTQINVLPTGLNQTANKFYTPTALATLVTSANA